MSKYTSRGSTYTSGNKFFSHMLATLNQHMGLYGYELIDLPTIQPAELFLVKAGDQIINSLFTFERQGKQLSLRPEFTVLAANHYAQNYFGSVSRWQYAGTVFEDTSQKSENYEQLSIGAELIGVKGDFADSEIIAMSTIGLEKIGAPTVTISIGNVGILRALIATFDLDPRTERFLLHQIPAINDITKGIQWILDQFDHDYTQSSQSAFATLPILDSDGKNMTMGGRTLDEITRRLKTKQERYDNRKNVIEALALLQKWCAISGTPHDIFPQLEEICVLAENDYATELLRNWQRVISLLDAHGISGEKIRIKPDLVRSWEYYSGLIFELSSSGIHVGGGGRYNELVRLVGAKENVPAVGFAYYGNKLQALLEIKPEVASSDLSVTNVRCQTQQLADAIALAQTMRSHEIETVIQPMVGQTDFSPTDIIVQQDRSFLFSGHLYNSTQIDLLISQLKMNT